MPSLVELIRASTPQEQAAALAELVGVTLARSGGVPVAVCDARSRTIGYLSTTVNAAATLPLPNWTEEELAELRRRIDNPRNGLSVEEFIRRFEAETAEEKLR
jgi:hypothetical protein